MLPKATTANLFERMGGARGARLSVKPSWRAVLALVVLCLCACDDPPVLDQIGVTRTDQAPVVLFYACSSEQVSRVAFEASSEGGEPPRILWSIEPTTPGQSPNEFTLGVVPEGYREVVPLVSSTDPAEPINAVVDTTRRAGYLVTFEPQTLEPGHVQQPGDVVRSVSDFQTESAKACR